MATRVINEGDVVRVTVPLVGETLAGDPVLIAAGEQAIVAVQPSAVADWIYLEVEDRRTGAVVALAAAPHDLVEVVRPAEGWDPGDALGTFRTA